MVVLVSEMEKSSSTPRFNSTGKRIKSTGVFNLPMEIAVQLLWYLECVTKIIWMSCIEGLFKSSYMESD